MQKITFNVDRLLVREGMWRISGWCFSDAHSIKGISVVVKYAGGEVRQRLAASIYRADVESDFPDREHSRNSGFSGFGSGRPDPVVQVRLVVEFDNGEQATLDATRFLSRKRQMAVRAWGKVKRLIHLLAKGQFSDIAVKSWNFGKRRLTGLRRHKPETVRSDVLIFDHGMGGGANLFSERLIHKLCAAGQGVLVVRFYIDALGYEMEYHRTGMHVAWPAKSAETLFRSLRAYPVKTIIVNTLASYLNAPAMLEKISELAQRSRAQLHYYFHDHHSICSSPFLLDYKGDYCGIPDVETCANCLSQHSNIFVASQRLERIEPWRAAWASFFAKCNEIRFFSEASHQTFLRVYPVDPARCVVEGHDTSYMAEDIGTVNLRPGSELRIGVMGHISSSKGALKVKALCDYIAASGMKADIIVIGTIDLPVSYPFLKITGAYHVNRLARIVERERINVAFFPSICPETFSYTISELIYMGLPVAAFDLGAPAERLSKRSDSAVLPLHATPQETLDVLKKIALKPRAGQLPPRERSKICAFTSAATNYLPKALLLGESLKRFHPEIDRYYGLCDARDDRIDYDRGVFTGVLESKDLDIPEFASWRLRHSIVEFCTAVKPFMLERLLDEGHELVLYFDPDMVLFSRLDDLIEKAMNSSIVLTPHLTKPEQEVDAILDNEIYGALQHGTYNLGFLGVRNTPEGRRFARWWADRLYKWCKEDLAMGLWTDQKWVDLAPGFFDNVGILRSPRYNVAPWNITQRHLDGSFADGFTVNGEPLGFYHFTGFDNGSHRVMAMKYGQGNQSLLSLIDWYQEKTRFAADDPAASVKWSYR